MPISAISHKERQVVPFHVYVTICHAQPVFQLEEVALEHIFRIYVESDLVKSFQYGGIH